MRRSSGPGVLRSIRMLASHMQHFALDAEGARAISPGSSPATDTSASPPPTPTGSAPAASRAKAVKNGIGTGTPTAGLTVGVPDGVKALRARKRGGTSEALAVNNNGAPLPFSAYAWDLVRWASSSNWHAPTEQG